MRSQPGEHPSHAEHEDHTEHDAHAGHGPHMAIMMRNLFFASAVITIIEILYSPLGTRLLDLNLPTPFGIPNELFQFLLTTPVVFWGGRPFLSVAWKALLKGQLNMATLIATGIMTAYLYSVILIPVAAGALAIFPNLPIYLRELHPIAAAFAMAFSSVTVVGNSLRLRRAKI